MICVDDRIQFNLFQSTLLTRTCDVSLLAMVVCSESLYNV